MKALIEGRISLIETKERDGKAPLVTLFVQQPKETVKVYTNPGDLALYSPEGGLEEDGPKYLLPVEIRADVYRDKASMMVTLDGQVSEIVTRRNVGASQEASS